MGLSIADCKLITNDRTQAGAEGHKKSSDPIAHPTLGRLKDWLPIGNYPEAVKWLKENNCWEAHEAGYTLFFDVRRNRVVFPSVVGNRIIDATGRLLGWADLPIEQRRTIPKWLRYARTQVPLTINPFGFSSDKIVIVEDAASACSVSRVCKAVALMGTNLTEEAKHVLFERVSMMASATSEAIICLDRDATRKALSLSKELQAYIPAKVKVLSDDAKYLSKEQLIKELGI